MSGVTTMIGGGTGPATGTNATTCTPGPWNIGMMLKATDSLPMNLGFLGKGNASLPLALEREDLREYFENALDGLVSDGILFLDAYGGYDSHRNIEEERECDDFTYIWEQAEFNPIDSCMTCHIHFEFPDKSRMEKAFSYRWRLWTLPEIREILLEAGFSQVDIYWEGTDEKNNEGNGIYTPSEIGDADPGWVCYIVAQA